MARSPAVRRARRWMLLGVGSASALVLSSTGGFGSFTPFSNTSQQVATASGLSVASVVLSGDPGGTALTESVVDMLPGDYRERVIDLTVPYDVDVSYSVKADIISDGTPTAIEVSQPGDALNNLTGTNAGLAATDLSDLNAPAGQGGLFVEIYRCTGAGNSYESTAGAVAGRTDDREVSCNNAGAPQGAKGNGTAVTHTDLGESGGVVTMSAGATHTCAIEITGRLWCWGNNTNARTGLNTTTGTTRSPAAVGSDTDWQTVAAGSTHSCAVKTTGTLWCWGSNTNGRTGFNTTVGTALVPAQVGADTDWQSISAGNNHSCAVKTTGTLWCWGSNASGGTGLGTAAGNTLVPTQVGIDTNWAAVDAGSTHSCAVKTTGTLWCWGANTNGRTGLNTTVGTTLSPTQVGVDTNWQNVSAGTSHSCATKTTGTLWCWGSNTNARTGLNTTFGDTIVPTQAGVDTNWLQAGSGALHSCAIKTTGTLWCWGDNTNGATGRGTVTGNTLVPTQAGTDTNWSAIDVGDNHSCGARVEDDSRCWGDNASGQNGTARIAPTEYLTDGGWKQVSAGSTHSCAVKTTGTLWCWGSNFGGQTGLGTTTFQTLSPTQVGLDVNWSSVDVGESHSCAIKTTGTLWCWGANTNGRTGLNTTAGNTLTPTQVGTDTNWQQVNAGSSQSCATRTTGTLWCWGANLNGRTGLNTAAGDTLVPTQVGTDTNWALVAAGTAHTCATKTTGTLWCWGANTNGRTGFNTTAGDTLVPTQVGTDTNWQQVSAGFWHTCATKTVGTLSCWGNNGNGRTGLNTTFGDTLVPTQVGTDTNWAQIVAGGYFSCGLRTTDTLWCWGQNASGATGLGTVVGNTLVPTQVGTDSNWSSIDSGNQHTCGVRSNGALSCWGTNIYNELGDGTYFSLPSVVIITVSIGFSPPVVVRPAGQSLRLLIRVRLTNDGTTDGRQNVLLNEQINITHRFALVERAGGAV